MKTIIPPVTMLAACFLPALAAKVMADQFGDFGYSTNAISVTITNYTGAGGNVTIPDTIVGLPVTAIGTKAFYSQQALTAVTIPATVTSIGDYAFYYCVGLSGVSISDNVTNIGDRVFFGCISLSSITVGPLNAAYRSADGVLFNHDQSTLIQYPGGKSGAYTLPNGVATIGDSAFSLAINLSDVTIPGTVTMIQTSAFASCTNLGRLVVPGSVTNLGVYAFSSCSSLSNVIISKGVISLGSGAFFQCVGLASLSLGNSMTTIGPEAFSTCVNLATVTIPASVTSIGSYAFESCAKLTGVFFAGNQPTPGTGVFNSDGSATVYYLPGATGWSSTYAGRPAVLWNPQVLAGDPTFGVRTNRFGFTIAGTPNLPLVLEASINLANQVWVPLLNGTLTNGSIYFSDPQWSDYSERFYRLRSP